MILCPCPVGALAPRIRKINSRQLAISRAIRPFDDGLALWNLWRLFVLKKFQAVHTMSPKAGLLGMLAARLAGVPIRIHTFTGQVWATKHGLFRLLLKNLDRVTARLATHLLVDSQSQRRFLIAEKVLRNGQGLVAAKGSAVGVDLKKFRPNLRARKRCRRRLNIPPSAVLALFLGRFQSDKGLRELALAFRQASGVAKNLYLLLAGPDEAGLTEPLKGILTTVLSKVRWLGFTKRPEELMAAADFLVLPSHREGFGAVIIEAAACGIPSIGTRIYGLTDAIVEGKTGILVPPGNSRALARAMISLGRQHGMRQAMGRAARRRAQRDFRQEDVIRAILHHHEEALKET